jgi:hypothetical protein
MMTSHVRDDISKANIAKDWKPKTKSELRYPRKVVSWEYWAENRLDPGETHPG